MLKYSAFVQGNLLSVTADRRRGIYDCLCLSNLQIDLLEMVSFQHPRAKLAKQETLGASCMDMCLNCMNFYQLGTSSHGSYAITRHGQTRTYWQFTQQESSLLHCS